MIIVIATLQETTQSATWDPGMDLGYPGVGVLDAHVDLNLGEVDGGQPEIDSSPTSCDFGPICSRVSFKKFQDFMIWTGPCHIVAKPTGHVG